MSARKWPDHDEEFVDQPVLVEMEKVAALDRALADPRLEDKSQITTLVVDLARVAEVLKDFRHVLEQGDDRVLPLIRGIDNGTAKVQVFGHQFGQSIPIPALDSCVKRLHLGATFPL